jgi:hypothetical protein
LAYTRRCKACGAETVNPIAALCTCGALLPPLTTPLVPHALSPGVNAPSQSAATTAYNPTSGYGNDASLQGLNRVSATPWQQSTWPTAVNNTAPDGVATVPNWLGLVAGAGLVISAVSPWIDAGVYASSYGTVSYSWNGIHPYIGDGWYVLALGIAIGLVDLVSLIRGSHARHVHGLLEIMLAAVMVGIVSRYVMAAEVVSPGVSLTSFLYTNGASNSNVQIVSVGVGGGLQIAGFSAIILGIAGLWRLVSDG